MAAHATQAGEIKSSDCIPPEKANLRLGTEADLIGDPRVQAHLDPNILLLTATLVLQAMLRIPETGKPTQPFTKVQQGVSEPYMQFIDRLCDALDKQIDNREAKEALLQKLAVENANTDCKKVLQALPVNTTIVQMIEACNQVGSIEHHTESLASAFAAALTISQDPKGQKIMLSVWKPEPPNFRMPPAWARGRLARSSAHFMSQMWERTPRGEPLPL